MIDYSTGNAQLSTTNLASVTFSILNYNFGIHLLHRKTRVVSEWEYDSEHSSSSAEANVLLKSWSSRIWRLPRHCHPIITPQPSSIPKLRSGYASSFDIPWSCYMCTWTVWKKHFSCHIHRSRYLPDMITPKPSESHTRDDKPTKSLCCSNWI